MQVRKYYLTIVLVTAVILLSACSSDEKQAEPELVVPTAEESIEIDLSEPEIDALELEALETEAVAEIIEEIPHFDYDWQNLYYEKLSKYFNYAPIYPDVLMFNIYDFDGDGIPELILSSSSFTMAECEIFTVENGKIKSIGILEGCAGELRYDYERKYIHCEYRAWSCYILGIYQYENGEMTNIISFAKGDWDENGDFLDVYRINEDEVSEKTYNSEYEKYAFDEEYSPAFPGFLDTNSIDDFIANGTLIYYIDYDESVSEDEFYQAREKYLTETEGKFEARRYFTNQREVLYAFEQFFDNQTKNAKLVDFEIELLI